MSEEIKKEAQDAQINPEELDKAAGGYLIHHNSDEEDFTLYCGVCGAECIRDMQGQYRCPNGCEASNDQPREYWRR